MIPLVHSRSASETVLFVRWRSVRVWCWRLRCGRSLTCSRSTSPQTTSITTHCTHASKPHPLLVIFRSVSLSSDCVRSQCGAHARAAVLQARWRHRHLAQRQVRQRSGACAPKEQIVDLLDLLDGSTYSGLGVFGDTLADTLVRLCDCSQCNEWWSLKNNAGTPPHLILT